MSKRKCCFRYLKLNSYLAKGLHLGQIIYVYPLSHMFCCFPQLTAQLTNSEHRLMTIYLAIYYKTIWKQMECINNIMSDRQL